MIKDPNPYEETEIMYDVHNITLKYSILIFVSIQSYSDDVLFNSVDKSKLLFHFLTDAVPQFL